MTTCTVNINGVNKSFEVEGDFFWGEDECLFNPNDNVISKTNWVDKGYTITHLLSDEDFTRLKQSVKNTFIRILKENDIEVAEDFELEHYHRYVTTNDLHNKIIFKTRELTNDDFDFDLEKIVEKCTALVGYELASYNPELGRAHVQLRVNRPQSLDINPLHRDGYIGVYKNCINIWIPMAGCNLKSNLPMLPGSHLVNEKDILRTANRGAKINGNVYNVPCIMDVKGGLNLVREEIKDGDGIVFTPFLIHGAAFNENPDLTQITH